MESLIVHHRDVLAHLIVLHVAAEVVGTIGSVMHLDGGVGCSDIRSTTIGIIVVEHEFHGLCVHQVADSGVATSTVYGTGEEMMVIGRLPVAIG